MAFLPSAFLPSAFLTAGDSALAILEARAGIGRAGITRAGYFIPYPIIMIDAGDRTEYVQPESLRITLVINDEMDTAEFTIPSSTGFIPTPGQTVRIALGHVDNLIFGGDIRSQDHVFEMDGQATPWVSVRCGDWGRRFNRRLVNAYLGGMTVSDAVLYVVENFTSGFTTLRVDLSQTYVLPDDFEAINEEPLTTIRRIANLVKGGGCWIHPSRDLAFWGEGGDVSVYAQTPDPLVGGLWSLRDFRHSLDTTQWRTKVAAEGDSVQTVKAIPVGTDLGTYGIPLATTANAGLFNASTHAEANFFRAGSQVFSYDHAVLVSGPPAGVLASDESAGTTSIDVLNAGPGTIGGGWLCVDNVFFYAAGPTAPSFPNIHIAGIPASGYGSLTMDLKAGAIIYATHYLDTVVAHTLSGGVEREIKEGTALTVRAEVEDAAAAAAIAAIEDEDSDGVYEHVVPVSGGSYVGCLERAHAEVDVFKSTLPVATWVTQDMNAMPGYPVEAAFAEDGGLVATLVIQKVTLQFPHGIGKGDLEQRVSSWLPTRYCEGGLVKLQRLMDSI